ncbi:MAG: hypothetical protein J5I92_12775, partial [Thiogranum sp.]|nr:hypothetical protein [Thiogranum sp.]
PDIYQGCELFEFSLVDPDNRRPVDYAARQRLLDSLEPLLTAQRDVSADVRALLDTPQDGRAKLYLTAHLLRRRRAQAALFAEGVYRSLDAAGDGAGQVCSFVRCAEGGACVLVVAPCRFGALTAAGTRAPLGDDAWGDTVLLLPGDGVDSPSSAEQRTDWYELFTGRRFVTQTGADGCERLKLARLLDSFPVAVLLRDGAGQ